MPNLKTPLVWALIAGALATILNFAFAHLLGSTATSVLGTALFFVAFTGFWYLVTGPLAKFLGFPGAHRGC